MISVEGTVVVVSSDPHAKRTTCSIYKCTLQSFVSLSMKQISMFIILKTDYFQFSTKVISVFLMQENILKLSELNTFQAKKNDNIFHIINQIKVTFQGYCCESGIAIFAWEGSLEIALTVLLIFWLIREPKSSSRFSSTGNPMW